MRITRIFCERVGVVAVSLLLAGATGLALWGIHRPQNTPVPTTERTGVQDSRAPSNTPPCALVGEWEGKLAVFRDGAATPQEVYDVFVASLPEPEQEALAEKIPVYDEVELQKLLEDYTG